MLCYAVFNLRFCLAHKSVPLHPSRSVSFSGTRKNTCFGFSPAVFGSLFRPDKYRLFKALPIFVKSVISPAVLSRLLRTDCNAKSSGTLKYHRPYSAFHILIGSDASAQIV